MQVLMKRKKIIMQEKGKVFIILIILITVTTCNVQKDSVSFYIEETVDSIPKFPGGNEALDKYLKDSLNWTSVDFSGHGYVIAEFHINEDGTITDIKIKRSLDVFLDQEVIRVIKKMPLWKPAYYNGKHIKSTITLPVYFKLNDY